MKEISLTQGYVALIDDEDYEQLSNRVWFPRSLGSNGMYAGRTNNGTIILMHREILQITSPLILIDHKDGNGLNNQRCNIRIATRSQNGFNRAPNKNTSSIYKGVCWRSVNKNWTAQISVEGKIIYLGSFKKEIDAALAYNDAAKRLHGEFARLNDI